MPWRECDEPVVGCGHLLVPASSGPKRQGVPGKPWGLDPEKKANSVLRRARGLLLLSFMRIQLPINKHRGVQKYCKNIVSW